MASAWIRSPAFDSVFILAPAFVISAVVVAFPSIFSTASGETPVWGWVAFVLCIDVAHVYGTLYRTYFDRTARAERRNLLWSIPLVCWLVGIALYAAGTLWFWRVVAYIAVFHFVRQQYGFARIYSRKETLAAWERRVIAAAVYIATLVPLIYWHTHLPRAFSWFLDGDFLDSSVWFSRSTLEAINQICFYVYAAVLATYAFVEFRQTRKSRSNASRSQANWPRIALIGGTALSWFLGIVVYNGDLAFTATNVVAHGLPYMALTWNYWRATQARERRKLRWEWLSVPIFLLSLLVFAYAEEWLWDALVNRERPSVFFGVESLALEPGDATLAWLVPLLALPQLTHYVLDGFIWKMKDRGSEWKSMLEA